MFVRTVAATAQACLPIALAAAVKRPETAEDIDRRIAVWSRRVLQIAGIELRVSRRETVRSETSFVVMSNHQSHYDIPVLFQALQRRMRMVAKRELFQIPVFGEAMRAAGCVEIDRRERGHAIAALRGATRALSSGTDIWIAPEGTRSADGKLGPFKKGGFHLAIDAGVAVLPVGISGTLAVLPPHEWRVKRGVGVRVVVGQPLAPRATGPEGVAELMAAVRSAIEELSLESDGHELGPP